MLHVALGQSLFLYVTDTILKDLGKIESYQTTGKRVFQIELANNLVLLFVRIWIIA